MESMLVEQWAYRETDEHRENLFHQQSICLAVHSPQGLPLHFEVTLEEPKQSFPPFLASIFFVRLLVLVPPPHDLLQEPQFVHWAQTQSMAVK